jgi:signal transduction histidine kinase
LPVGRGKAAVGSAKPDRGGGDGFAGGSPIGGLGPRGIDRRRPGTFVGLRSSLRNRLLVTFSALVVVVGAGTLFAIERTLADDLTASLDVRLTTQGHEVAAWLANADHPDRGGARFGRVDRLAPRLAAVTGTRITIVGADGLILGDSREPSTVGQPVGAAWEVSRARRGEVGHAIRHLRDDEPPQYLVAVPADQGRVIRLALPLDDVLATRARMRNRLLVGGAFGTIGCLVLSWIFIRALTRPLQAMTRSAEKLAHGDYEVPPPIDSGGELGVLARAMNRMAGEVKARIGELTGQRDRIRSLEAARREFLSNAAHELRTPVTAISGYAETLLGGGVDPETSREFLTTIHRNAQRIAALVTDLLVLESIERRAEAGEGRTAIALAEVAGDAARTARGVTPTAQVEVDVAGELSVLGTRDGVEQIVQNLIDNAIKYGNDTAVTVRAQRIGARVQLAVSDRGPGIPDGHAERIFERFYRLDAGRSRDRGGSGLGLAIVKSQSEALGGRVWVEDGRPGARFVVELDAAWPPSA